METLILYGYSSSGAGRLLKLREVTLFADSKQVRDLSKFLAQCAKEMKTNPEWEHQHFAGGEFADIIVANSQNRTVGKMRKRTLLSSSE